MRFYRSIRWRLQFWYGALLVAVLCGFGATAYQLESSRQFRRIDEGLRQRLPVLVESQRPARSAEPGMREFSLAPKGAALFDGQGDSAFYYVVWLRHSEHPVNRSATAPADVPMPNVGDPPTRQRVGLREAFLYAGPGDCVLVGHHVAGDVASLRQLGWGLAGVGVAVLLVGLAGGAWLVSRALRPIGDISSTAGKIATGDLKQRIDTSDTDSELGELAAVLNATFARLDAAFVQQARFTADAAHELRTPVTVLLMHTQNGIESECANEEHREAFAASHRAAQRMRRLIESLLELARFDAGQEKLSRETVDLSRVARETLELVQPLADERRVALHEALSTVACTGDPVRIAQVVTNLLTNAVLHNKAGGEVWVETKMEAGFATVLIRDNGPGIPPDDLPRIFERFYRADKARASATGGTGLGLAIAKAIVDALGGSIGVISESGAGTCFEVRLPAAS